MINWRNNRKPRITRWLAMTDLTKVCCIGMRCRLSGRDNIVVATVACTNHLGVINITRCYRCPVRRKYRVAGITGIRSINMVSAFTGSQHSIVTGDTVCNKTGMVDCRTTPLVYGMTDITFLCRWNMRRALPRSNDTIVTTRTGT